MTEATQDRAPDAPPLVRDALVLPVHAVRLFVAVFLVALNLRAAIAAVPPLASTIQAELGISGAVMGSLTALPVLCMGLFAPLGTRLAHRLGRERAVALALCSLVLGQGVRLGGVTPGSSIDLPDRRRAPVDGRANLRLGARRRCDLAFAVSTS